MRIVHIQVKAQRRSATRSYFPDKEFIRQKLAQEGLGLCKQDGLIFQEKNPDGAWGIITLDDALSRPSVNGKIGWYGGEIIRRIARSRIRGKFVTGRFTSNFQLDVEFRGVPSEKVDRLIERAIGEAFAVRAKVVTE